MELSGDTSQMEIYKTALDVQRLSGKKLDSREQLKEVSSDFESLFVKMMLDAMRSSISDSALLPKNEGQKLFEDRLYSEYARKISNTSRLGIADMIYNQLESTLPPGEQVEIIA